MGRPKGAKNKVDADAKAVIAELIASRAGKVKTLWDSLAAAEDPHTKARAIELYAKLGEYVMSKPPRVTELTGKDGEPVRVVEILSYRRETT